jgi:pimeloyl-ACP methyl ester carboxylesterase
LTPAFVRRAFVALLVVVVGLPLLGLVYQRFETTRLDSAYPPLGTRVDVGGYRLHLYCSGTGSPTVLLEADAVSTSLSWSLVQPAVAEVTRVCAYDRAGLGWSDAATSARSSDAIVSDLRALLDAAGEAAPYVLVGHGAGGLYVRQFANAYPAQVAGMVLVDALHEDVLMPTPPILHENAATFEMCAALAPFGLPRLFRLPLPEVAAAPPQLIEAIWSRAYRSETCAAALAENAQLPAVARALAEAGGMLADKPLVVLTAGERPEMEWPLYDAVWIAAQDKLEALSTSSQQIPADQSRHFVQFDQPELVSSAIIRVVRAVRDRGDT